MAQHTLIPHIGLGHGVALYTSAILGAGVLVLPGQIASMAGPASLLSWLIASVLGGALAIMFAALAQTYPGAGGVATYVTTAFGGTPGGLTGWLFFAAGSLGMAIVPLTGGYYAARATGGGEGTAMLVAGVTLTLAVTANLAGARTSARTQLTLAATVALALAGTVVLASPRMDPAALAPFAPHGIAPIGAGVIILFFAFAGWEAIAHLAGEFRDPTRDLPRAVGTTLVLITVLYLGAASAVVLTGTYGTPEKDRVALGLLLEGSIGPASKGIAAVVATVICLGTTTAFVAGLARLGHSLAGERWLPPAVATISAKGVPTGGVVAVAVVAAATLGVTWWQGWGTETLMVVPATLVVGVYLLAAAAGVRLLRGTGRLCAVISLAMTLVVTPAALGDLVFPAVVVALALTSRWVLQGSAPVATG